MISSITLRGSSDSSENYGTMTLHIRLYQDIIVVAVIFVVRGEEEIISYHHERKNSFFLFVVILFCLRVSSEGFEVGKSSLRELHKAGSCSFELLFQHPRVDIGVVNEHRLTRTSNFDKSFQLKFWVSLYFISILNDCCWHSISIDDDL